MAGRPPLISAAERQRRVLSAAATVFSFHGYDIATLDEIAVISEVSKPAIYRLFASKAHLYAAVVEHHAAERATAAVQAFMVEGTVHFKLHSMIDAWFVEVETNPTSYLLSARPVPAHPVIEAAAAARHALQINHDILLIRALAPHVPEAEIEPIGEVVRGALVTLASWWLKHPETPRSVPVAAMMRVCEGIQRTHTETGSI
jgi:AcrR family transcriptional regulator